MHSKIEMQNYELARKFIVDNLHQPIDQDFIKTINNLILNGVNKPYEYAKSDGGVISNIYLGPDFTTINALILIKNFLDYHNSNIKNNLPPIEIAARFYWGLVKIHPFDDGNGRTALILTVRILLDYGYTEVECRKLEKIFETERSNFCNALKDKVTYSDYNDNYYGFKYTSNKWLQYMSDCEKKVKILLN